MSKKKNEREIEVSNKKEVETASGEPTREGLLFTPEVDIIEDAEGITLYADLPGVNREDLDIDVREGVLSLSGAVKEPEERYRSLYNEYRVGGFHRKFNLGERIDPSKITAKLNNGVLALTLPRAAEHKPRKIQVAAE